jgi:hypothetical protein
MTRISAGDRCGPTPDPSVSRLRAVALSCHSEAKRRIPHSFFALFVLAPISKPFPPASSALWLRAVALSCHSEAKRRIPHSFRLIRLCLLLLALRRCPNSAFLSLGNEAAFAFIFSSRQRMFLGPTAAEVTYIQTYLFVI